MLLIVRYVAEKKFVFDVVVRESNDVELVTQKSTRGVKEYAAPQLGAKEVLDDGGAKATSRPEASTATMRTRNSAPTNDQEAAAAHLGIPPLT